MEETHRYPLPSPSGWVFSSSYVVKYIILSDGSRRNITAALYVGDPKSGNPLDACTTITIQYPDSVKEFEEKYGRPSIIDPSIASLVLTKYSPACAINRPLRGGEGTIEMILSAMSLVKQICPFVKAFDLNDASSKQCDNKSSISLPYFYLTNHRKTWYEAKFGARLPPDTMETYRKTVEDVWSSPLESFEVFRTRFLSRVASPLQEAIRQAYEGSEDTQTFFKRLYDLHGTNMVCMLLQGWIDDYMRLVKIEPFVKHHKWYISVDRVPTIPFKVSKNVHRVTRKKNNGARRKSLWNNNGHGRNHSQKD
jgi:hypothetical protein